jgi:serine/threonine protein kinase
VTIEVARQLLGVANTATLPEVEAAWKAKRAAVEQRIAAAPTDNLKARFRQALDELDQAHEFLKLAMRPASGLSQTQYADLPAAAPGFTAQPAAPGRQLQRGAVLKQRYEIRRLIDTGGMGAVYAAWDRDKSEEIAVKVLLPHLTAHPEARKRFLEEGKIASALSHEAIVNVFDVTADGEHHFLTMELLRGQTLRKLMKARADARQPFTAEEAVAIGRTIGRALAHAHRRTVHRDVKPENIWVDEENHYKLMDFGIARLQSTSQFTRTATALGTAYYMAPEQLKGLGDIDHRADQYSLGVLLYELLSGEIPAGRIKPLYGRIKGVSRALSDAIDRALEPEPQARHPNMEAFVQALSSRSAGLARPLQLAVAGLLGVAVLYLAWPALKQFLPSPGAGAAQQAAALGAQGVIDTLLRRLDDRNREIDNRLREAKASVDRYDGQVRMARNDAERRDLAARLSAAKVDAELWSEIRERAQSGIFLSDALVDIRRQKAIGDAALRQNDHAQAATALLAAQGKLEELLRQADQIEGALQQRRVATARYRQLRAAADREKVNASTFSSIELLLQSSAESLDRGKFDAALDAYQRATAEIGRVGRLLLDQWKADYTQRAATALKTGRTGEARALIERAKTLEALRAEI